MTSPLPPFTHPRLLLAFHFGISFGTAYTREISPVASPSDKSRWDAFRAYIKEYQAATHKIFRQRTSTSVTKRNRMNVTRRDVRNMISRMEEERRGGATTEEHLEAVLRGLCESRGNRATVFVDEDKRALTITLRAQQMRRWFKASPEVKLIDATHIDAAHNTNESSSCSW
ncbi:hypothetical protein PF010_g10062 [Phytophthora fragariae]|uniref:ZSWIM1/3 RNaseH-like domain-containing protein n=1 Tax=Phytophthora fragariae TaxID=53985 RepID=A0A6G0L9N9_9STRA|nr:hypothetical protein PF010_g10062 [Phytophthora fragariae]